MTYAELREEGVQTWFRSTQKAPLAKYLARWMFLNKWRLGPTNAR